jgi:hypothetical protein
MSDALPLGEKLLSLLGETGRVSTYKPALLLALIDRVQEFAPGEPVPVTSLAERVIELYWPQTLAYPTTGDVLSQNQGPRQATIVSEILDFRSEHAARSRVLAPTLRLSDGWSILVKHVEETLAEWPIPRLQRPYHPFIYEFDWGWAEAGGWSVREYRAGSRALKLHPGVAEALTTLAPLLRPFITRWWTDKAAQLNPDVEAARSVLEFEEFLFGRDRIALERVAEGLLDLQRGACFYCGGRIGKNREVDHFIPWSYSGDDGLDNLVAACRACNGSKRATLPGPDHLANLFERNRVWDGDLGALARERSWPRDRDRSGRITRFAYVRSPDERPIWSRSDGGVLFETVGVRRGEIERLIRAAPA